MLCVTARQGRYPVAKLILMKANDRSRCLRRGHLWTHTKGGLYHDGRFPTLRAVVDHYDICFGLGLGDQDKADLVEFMKSLPAKHGDE
jgi:hypothetical protein